MTSYRSPRGLWLGAGALFVTLFVGKQGMWSIVSRQVSEIRYDEHEKAVNSLSEATKVGKSFSLPPLSEAQRLKLKGALQQKTDTKK